MSSNPIQFWGLTFHIVVDRLRLKIHLAIIVERQ
jgi:hypothetical protein